MTVLRISCQGAGPSLVQAARTLVALKQNVSYTSTADFFAQAQQQLGSSSGISKEAASSQ